MSKIIQENVRTEANPEGCLLGGVDDYAQVLIIDQDALKKRFVEDKKIWDDEIVAAEKEKTEFDDKMKTLWNKF